MGIEDFDYLLRDLEQAFGTYALVRRLAPGAAVHRIKGRFLVDPFDVTQPGSDASLKVTQTIFYYDRRHTYEVVGPGVAPPEQGDHLIIRGNEYEVVTIDRDDLGEHALQLLLIPPDNKTDHQEHGP